MEKIFTLKNAGLFLVAVSGALIASKVNDNMTVHAIAAVAGALGTLILKIA